MSESAFADGEGGMSGGASAHGEDGMSGGASAHGEDGMSEDAYKGEVLTELLMELLKEFRKRYRHMDEICRLTKELTDGLSRDDRVTARMVLDMRGKELEAMSECDRHIQIFQGSMPDEEGGRLKALLEGSTKADGFEYTGLWKDIKETAERTKAVWKRTVELDRLTSARIAGDDSYYSNR